MRTASTWFHSQFNRSLPATIAVLFLGGGLAIVGCVPSQSASGGIEGRSSALDPVGTPINSEISVRTATQGPCPGNPAFGDELISTSLAIVPGSLFGVAGVKDDPFVLVTSCSTSFADHPVDATTLNITSISNPANSTTLVTSIDTSFAGNAGVVFPENGWGAFALRGNRGDLVACANTIAGASGNAGTFHDVFSIDPKSGKARKLFTLNKKDHGTCDGLAWDSTDNTFWYVADGGDLNPVQESDLFHYQENGTPIPADTQITPCFVNAGITVGLNNTIYLNCDENANLYQGVRPGPGQPYVFTQKGTTQTLQGGVLTDTLTHDLECDPISFSGPPHNTDVIWSKVGFADAVQGFEVPLGTCSISGISAQQIPVQQVSTCPPPTNVDTDGDGLLDCWEMTAAEINAVAGTNLSGPTGIDIDGDGVVDLNLFALSTVASTAGGAIPADIVTSGPLLNPLATVVAGNRPDPKSKDMYLEIDYMVNHYPRPDAVNQVIARFLGWAVPNTGGTLGIRLHVLLNDTIPETGNNNAPRTKFGNCGGPSPTSDNDFDTIKAANFGTSAESAKTKLAKKAVFRYQLWGHEMAVTTGTSPSGCAELPGDDSVVMQADLQAASSGELTPLPFGTQIGIMLHELGHNMNLRHGGFEDDKPGAVAGLRSAKPNYISVMNPQLATSSWIATVGANSFTFSKDFSKVITVMDETQINENNGTDPTIDQTAKPSPDQPWQPTFGGIVGSSSGGASTDLMPTVAWVPSTGSFRPFVVNPSSQGAGNVSVRDLDFDRQITAQTYCADLDGDGFPTIDINNATEPNHCVSSTNSPSLLYSQNDWLHVQYTFNKDPDYAPLVHFTTVAAVEPSSSQVLAQSFDTDGDGVKDVVDNCPGVANANQADLNHDGIGDACAMQATVACVDKLAAQSYRAHFGYVNQNTPITVLVGPNNQVAPPPADRGQPTAINGGTFPDVFTAAFTTAPVSWTLKGSTATASARTHHCGSTTPDDENEVILGCEDSAFWNTTIGTATLANSTTHTEGTASLSVTGSGFFEVTSSTVESTNGVGTEIDYDVQVPAAITTGTTQVFISAPSKNVNHLSIGTVSLIGFPVNQFRTVKVTIPASVRTQLAGKIDDLRVHIAINVSAPSGSRTYLIDNIKLGLTAPPLVDDATTAARVMGFESVPDWTAILNGTTAVTLGVAATHSQGTAAISFPGSNGGNIVMTSRILRALPAAPTTHLAFDVLIPQTQPNSNNFGQVQLSVSAPSRGLTNAFIGNIGLTGLARNQYVTLTLNVPANIVTALGQSFDDLRFSYQFTLPSGATGTYAIDNLRFTP